MKESEEGPETTMKLSATVNATSTFTIRKVRTLPAYFTSKKCTLSQIPASVQSEQFRTNTDERVLSSSGTLKIKENSSIYLNENSSFKVDVDQKIYAEAEANIDETELSIVKPLQANRKAANVKNVDKDNFVAISILSDDEYSTTLSTTDSIRQNCRYGSSCYRYFSIFLK